MSGPLFTPRLVEGTFRAPRVIFMDPVSKLTESFPDRFTRTFDQYGEATFAVNRYAILKGYRQRGRSCSLLELPEYGAPELVRQMGLTIHTVFAATFPPAWETGQVRSYALSSPSPTIGDGIRAHKWLTRLGPEASNRLLWSDRAAQSPQKRTRDGQLP